MGIQKTPPLGWPHTEAEKYAVKETREILRKGAELGHAPAKPSKPGKTKGSGCGCVGGLVTILILLAIAGVVAAIVVPEIVSSGAEAQDVFADAHPGWEIESFDEPDGAGGPVRLVVWDYDRSIGRLVMMDPSDGDPAWVERPLIRGGVQEWETGELLDAFGEAYSGLSWSYIMEAELLGGADDGSTETWRVSYRVWPMESNDEWTGVQTAVATRIPDLGSWVVVGPAGLGDTPETIEESAVAE